MWSQVLGLALLVSLNPMLLGFILLVISRPRPVQNLLAFWVGCLSVNLPAFLGCLLIAHLIPSFSSFATDIATPDPGSSIKPFQLGSGLFALAVAVLMATRMVIRRRTREPVAVGATGAEPLVEEQPETNARSLFHRGKALVQRVMKRGGEAWDGGALWVAFLLGVAYLPPPPLLLMVVTIVVGSGVAVGTQVIAMLAFVFAMLLIFEIVLASYVIAPRRTQAVLRPVHDWALAHRQAVLLVLFVVVGLWMVYTGVAPGF
jgi:hypothetical protein